MKKKQEYVVLYDAAFEEIKDTLPELYIEVSKVDTQLKAMTDFYLHYETPLSGVYPRLLLRSKEGTADISDALTIKPESDAVQVGYKRQDDFLDMKGNLISRSPKLIRTLEYIKADKSWLKWTFYKIGQSFRKLFKVFSKRS